MQEVQTTLPIGTIVRGRYVIEGLLGRGGFGAVYLVRDQRVKGNLFALKELVDTSKQERARFAFESEVLKRLDHPALPHVYLTFEDVKNNRAYMLMDYIEGPNLETLRQKQPGKRFTLPQVMKMMGPIMDAVSYLHSQKPPIIHRDIKPANIIVPNEDDHPVLVDFGIAKEYDPDSTTTAVRRCSPGYGAPEQYSRGTNTRTDIYGLAATFYCLLTGYVPEDAFYRMTQLGSRGTDPLEPVNQLVPEIPQAVSDALQHAMAISSTDRFPSIEQFWHSLKESTKGQDRQEAAAPMALPSATTAVATKKIDEIPTVSLRKRPAAGSATDTRRRKLGWLPFLIVLVALALGLGVAAAFLLASSGSGGHLFLPSSNPTIVSHPRAVTTPKLTVGSTPIHMPTVVPRATPTATPIPKPKPTPTPTPVPPVYPNVAGTHYGTVHNTTANINANMSVSLRQGQGGRLSGYVTINPPLQGSGPIIYGFVGTDNSIRFTVQGYNGNAALFFYGTVYRDGSMSGSYCSLDTTGNCNANVGAQGTWSVGAVAGPPGSFSFFPLNKRDTLD